MHPLNSSAVVVTEYDFRELKKYVVFRTYYNKFVPDIKKKSLFSKNND